MTLEPETIIKYQAPIPFRWIVDYFAKIGSKCLSKAVNLDEASDYGFKYRFYSKVWNFTDFFSSRWGTYYTLNIKAWKEKLNGQAWDDYDSDGIPYWDNFWNEDPITGDAWRIFKKDKYEMLTEI